MLSSSVPVKNLIAINMFFNHQNKLFKPQCCRIRAPYTFFPVKECAAYPLISDGFSTNFIAWQMSTN